MSNIFDLFGTLNSNTPGHKFKRGDCETVVNSTPSRSFSDNGNMALKGSMANAGAKPKGLSLRQQYDPNISNTNSKQTTKKKSSVKSTLKAVSSNLNTLSKTPHDNKDRIAKIQTVREKQRKGLSPIFKSPHSKFSTPKQTEEFKFKRPTTPHDVKKNSIIYPEPEKLSYYFNQEEFDRISLDQLSLDKGFNDLILSRKNIVPFEDEGFISDPEQLNVPSLSPINFFNSESDYTDEIAMAIPEMPIISDEDDDF